jgi:ankyrin repeat protein
MRGNRYCGLFTLAAMLVLSVCAAYVQQDRKIGADRLIQAVGSDDVGQVRALLRAGVNPNAPNFWHIPPLTEAVERGRDIALIGLLLDNGANIEGRDQAGNTPLLTAAAAEAHEETVQNRLEEIELLLQRGADLKAQNARGNTALALAMQPGHHRIVRLLIDRGADMMTVSAGDPFTPLHVAAFANHTNHVLELLREGASVNAPSWLGTPLLLAAEGGSTSTLQALLTAGADVNARAEQFGVSITPLLCALENGRVEAAQLLVAHGADVNARQEQQRILYATALILAFRLRDMAPDRDQETLAEADARHTQIDALIGQMLDRGANPNVVSAFGDCPLAQAIQRARYDSDKHVEWVKPLLDHGADVNIKLQHYGSPLHIAIDSRRKDLHLPLLLLDRGADINAVDNENVTVLLDAVKAQDFGLAQLLLQRGAVAECYDSAHKSPLLWAAYYGQFDLVKLLLAHGALLNTKDVIGQTAAMLAQKGNHPEVAAFLKERGGAVAPADTPKLNVLHHVVISLPLRWLPGYRPYAPVVFAVRDGAASPVGANPPALLLLQNGREIARPVTFGSLFTGTALWTPAQRNNIAYQIGRGYYSADAYQFFGLATTRNGAYLGLLWYSPAASAEDQVAQFVFGLRVAGNSLELEVVKALDGSAQSLSRNSPLPKLQPSAEGDPILIDWTGRHRYLPNGQWENVEGE